MLRLVAPSTHLSLFVDEAPIRSGIAGVADGKGMIDVEVIVERCAFLDVHRDTVMACARTPDGHGDRREEATEFGSTTSQLLALSDWLAERRVTLVGMEATGVYWKPVHWVLEASIPEVWVINARHMRNVPGRKTR